MPAKPRLTARAGEALVANPMTRRHAAYADLLMEAADPRRVHSGAARWRMKRSASERRKLKTRRPLLRKHRSEWLGSLEPFLHGDQRVARGSLEAGLIP